MPRKKWQRRKLTILDQHHKIVAENLSTFVDIPSNIQVKDKNSNVNSYYCEHPNIHEYKNEWHRFRGFRLGCAECEDRVIRSTADFILRKYRSYQNRSRKKRREFSLKFKQFWLIIKQECFYCENVGSLKKQISPFVTIRYNTIDRIDSNLGYTTANSIGCCISCNRQKNNRKYDDFVDNLDTKFFPAQIEMLGRKYDPSQLNDSNYEELTDVNLTNYDKAVITEDYISMDDYLEHFGLTSETLEIMFSGRLQDLYDMFTEEDLKNHFSKDFVDSINHWNW